MLTTVITILRKSYFSTSSVGSMSITIENQRVSDYTIHVLMSAFSH